MGCKCIKPNNFICFAGYVFNISYEKDLTKYSENLFIRSRKDMSRPTTRDTLME